MALSNRVSRTSLAFQSSTLPITTADAGCSSNAVHSDHPLSIQTDLARSSGYRDTTANDVPELFYDYDQYDTDYNSTSPPSAASSSLMPTPLYDLDMPLPVDGPPNAPSMQKEGHSLDQWSYSPNDAYGSLCSPYPQWDVGYSSTQLQYHPSSAYEYPDEFDWENQRFTPEDSPSYHLHNSAVQSHYGSNSQSNSSSHPAPARYDTKHHKQFNLASSSSASSSTSTFDTSSTISPSRLMLHQNTPSSPASTPTSAISQLSTSQLHHPRPSRRIPIISLDELASASDAVLQKKASQTLSRSPVPALSPLPIDCKGFAPGPVQQFYLETSTIGPHFPPFPSAPTVISRGGMAVITCSCGCMESFAM